MRQFLQRLCHTARELRRERSPRTARPRRRDRAGSIPVSACVRQTVQDLHKWLRQRSGPGKALNLQERLRRRVRRVPAPLLGITRFAPADRRMRVQRRSSLGPPCAARPERQALWPEFAPVRANALTEWGAADAERKALGATTKHCELICMSMPASLARSRAPLCGDVFTRSHFRQGWFVLVRTLSSEGHVVSGDGLGSQARDRQRERGLVYRRPIGG